MIETPGGTRCRQSVNSSGPYLDIGFGVTQDQNYSSDADSEDEGLLGYARVVIPLSGTVKRIDCARLYELEIQRLQMEIELMRMGLQ